MAVDANVLTAKQFNSFEELAEIALGWNADFRQLSLETSNSKIFQARVGSMLVSNARFGCHVDQCGSTPAGMRTFAILDADCPPIYWFGHLVQQDVLLLFPAHQEIHAHSRPGFGVTTFAIPELLLADFFARNTGLQLDKVLGFGECIVPAPSPLLTKVRSLLRKAEVLSLNRDKLATQLGLYEEIQNEILFFLLDIFGNMEEREKSMRAPNIRSFQHLLKFIDANADTSLSVTELGRIANLSERTIRNLFQRELCMSPKSYLKGQRIYRAHRDLWHGDPSHKLVSDIANKWGFWHMGQFAADYKKLFGELPSDTLKGSVSTGV
ncbi:MAG: AraC family transcriptional regulator [Gammaproteobacteria bacterium]|nr:AraC family transcriptional regulator [Gammaproteobacteria bacterium]MCP4083041.1 AraC family transcriptional regulator [Planctomycetaceae bacterium]